MTDRPLKIRAKDMRILGIILTAGIALAGGTCLAQTQADTVLAQRRASHLRHGINLSEWFAQVYDQKGYT
ncbi:MAG TPA: hypothetical protein VEU98_11420, partial [Candidatus Eremiobacteraceae bacterium]|nr:hypothetical protein [Candidatus Eremiobacteraceae bacterium]